MWNLSCYDATGPTEIEQAYKVQTLCIRAITVISEPLKTNSRPKLILKSRRRAEDRRHQGRRSRGRRFGQAPFRLMLNNK